MDNDLVELLNVNQVTTTSKLVLKKETDRKATESPSAWGGGQGLSEIESELTGEREQQGGHSTKSQEEKDSLDDRG